MIEVVEVIVVGRDVGAMEMEEEQRGRRSLSLRGNNHQHSNLVRGGNRPQAVRLPSSRLGMVAAQVENIMVLLLIVRLRHTIRCHVDSSRNGETAENVVGR